MVMGDMNMHSDMQGERVNRNGEILITEFIDEIDLENQNVTLAKKSVTRDREQSSKNGTECIKVSRCRSCER